MPCIVALLALLAPRFLIAVLWFLTTWFRGMFDNLLWPIVGLVVALMIDISPASSRRRAREA